MASNLGPCAYLCGLNATQVFWEDGGNLEVHVCDRHARRYNGCDPWGASKNGVAKTVAPQNFKAPDPFFVNAQITALDHLLGNSKVIP